MQDSDNKTAINRKVIWDGNVCWALELERSKWSGGGKIHWEVGVGSHFLGFSRFGRERGVLWSLEESGFLQRGDEELGANRNGQDQTRSLTPSL